MHYYNLLLKFYQYLNEEKKRNLTIGIGISVLDPIDTERNLTFDITMSEYSLDDKEKLMNTVDKGIIINYDFNNLCAISNSIITKLSKANKIQSIVFDSSTFKFLRNIKFIASLYYFTLQTNGSIFIETNSPFSISFVLTNLKELYSEINKNKGGFKFQYAIMVLNHIKHLIAKEKIECVEKHIVSKEKVYSHNIDYLQKWFYGSKIELLNNEDEAYPITNPRYPIKKYYKITKILEHEEILEYLKININEINEGLSLTGVAIIDNRE